MPNNIKWYYLHLDNFQEKESALFNFSIVHQKKKNEVLVFGINVVK